MKLRTVDGKFVDDGIDDDSIEMIPERAEELAKVIKYMQDIFDFYDTKLEVEAMRGFGDMKLNLTFTSESDFLLTFEQIADMLDFIVPNAVHINRNDTENGIEMTLEFLDVYRKKKK